MSNRCWFERVCGKKEICDNCKNLENCIRYNQMYLQTVSANIPGVFPFRHQLERPKDQSSPDWEVYRNLYLLNMESFVKEGKSMVIESSNHGNGKTTFAINKLIEYLATQLGKSNAGYFLNLPQALFEIKEAITTKENLPYENIFSNVRLLVIDDVAHKKYSEFEENWLLRVISARQLKGLATIYTMTSGIKSIDNKEYNLISLMGDRLYSRIYTGSAHYFLAECDKRSWEKMEW